MPGITDRKLVQEQASLAGFRLADKSVKLLLQWLANGANEEELQPLFSIVDTGRWRTSRRCVGRHFVCRCALVSLR